MLKDGIFGVTTDQIKLKRTVEMYQWEEESHTETEDEVGGGQTETTTYSYHTKWSDTPIDSSSFYEQKGHRNPTTWKYQSETFVQDKITLGDLMLTDVFVNQLNTWKSQAINKEELLIKEKKPSNVQDVALDGS